MDNKINNDMDIHPKFDYQNLPLLDIISKVDDQKHPINGSVHLNTVIQKWMICTNC